jgi:hypothetical protein
MSASIRIAEKIHAIILVENMMLPNSYDISYTLSMHTKKVHEQNIVIERLRFFSDSMISNTIMLEHGTKFMDTVENKYAVFDSAPYDNTLSNILYLKASSILEGRATVESMSLSSRLGQEIDYFADVEDDYSEYKTCGWLPKNRRPWWLREDLSTNDDETIGIDWTDLGLGWKELKEDSEPTIIQFPKFVPKVIQGDVDAS